MVPSELTEKTRPTGPDDPAPVGGSRPFWQANRVSIIAAAVASGLAAAVYLSFPHQTGVESLWALLAMLSPFAAATIAVGWLDVGWAQRLKLHVVLPTACFLVFFCYFVPRIFYYGGLGDSFDGLYHTVLMLVPFIILSLALCLRLAGARTSTVVRVAAGLLILQLSGIEDLAFLTVNDLSGTDFSPIPEVWTWADHMAVRLGHHPTKHEAYVFIAVHVIVAVLVLALPGRTIRAVGQWWRTRREGPPA
jgi:hypothetical protein